MDIYSRARAGLLDYQVRCSQYSWIHIEDSANACRNNNIFTISVMVLTSISASESIIAGNIISKDTSLYSALTIANSVILYTITALSGMRQYLNYERDSELHKTASTRFLNMSNNIKKFLVLDTGEKEDIIEYYKWVSSEFENILASSPATSLGSLKKFEKTFAIQVKNNDVFDTQILEEAPPRVQESELDKRQRAIRYEIDRFLVNSYT